MPSRALRLKRAVGERLLGPSHKWFVGNAFRAVLFRAPDEEGLRHYVGHLRSGRMSRFEVLRNIVSSQEAAKHVLFGPGIRDHVVSFTGSARGVDAPAVLFLHPMKTGGTALSTALSRLADPWPRILDAWADQLVCFPRPMLEQAKLVTGHLPYGVLAVLPPGTVTVTIVRDPVKRTLSHFSHLRTHGQQHDLTIEQFVTDPAWRAVWEDFQARQLAIDVPAEDAWLGRVDGSLQEIVDAPNLLPFEELEARACARLEQIDIVGVSDDLDAVVRAVAERWGKPAPEPVPRANESRAPVRTDEVPEALILEIIAGTRADAALYARAKERADKL